MKRIMPLVIEFHDVAASDSEKRLQLAYNRIFEIARRNIIQKKQSKERRTK